LIGCVTMCAVAVRNLPRQPYISMGRAFVCSLQMLSCTITVGCVTPPSPYADPTVLDQLNREFSKFAEDLRENAAVRRRAYHALDSCFADLEVPSIVLVRVNEIKQLMLEMENLKDRSLSIRSELEDHRREIDEFRMIAELHLDDAEERGEATSQKLEVVRIYDQLMIESYLEPYRDMVLRGLETASGVEPVRYTQASVQEIENICQEVTLLNQQDPRGFREIMARIEADLEAESGEGRWRSSLREIEDFKRTLDENAEPLRAEFSEGRQLMHVTLQSLAESLSL
jgi:hypothetical protein